MPTAIESDVDVDTDAPAHSDDHDADADDEAGNKSDQKTDDVSPSPALDIEGVVIGEPDNGGVQSEGGGQHMSDDNENEVIYLYLYRSS